MLSSIFRAIDTTSSLRTLVNCLEYLSTLSDWSLNDYFWVLSAQYSRFHFGAQGLTNHHLSSIIPNITCVLYQPTTIAEKSCVCNEIYFIIDVCLTRSRYFATNRLQQGRNRSIHVTSFKTFKSHSMFFVFEYLTSPFRLSFRIFMIVAWLIFFYKIFQLRIL